MSEETKFIFLHDEDERDYSYGVFPANCFSEALVDYVIWHNGEGRVTALFSKLIHNTPNLSAEDMVECYAVMFPHSPEIKDVYVLGRKIF